MVSGACRRCGEAMGEGDACAACGLATAVFPCDRHPDATAVGRCVVCGRALCRTCSAGEGRVHLCDGHASVNVIQGWAQVYSTTNEFDAQLLRENLAAEGIEARIFSQKDQMLSVDLGELSIVRLLVPVWEFEAAEEIIRSHMDEEGEVLFACPSCGEAYEPGLDSCAACGSPLAGGQPR